MFSRTTTLVVLMGFIACQEPAATDCVGGSCLAPNEGTLGGATANGGADSEASADPGSASATAAVDAPGELAPARSASGGAAAAAAGGGSALSTEPDVAARARGQLGLDSASAGGTAPSSTTDSASAVDLGATSSIARNLFALNGAAPRGNPSGDVPWVNGYAELATAGVQVSGHVEYSISVSAAVDAIAQEELISFIQSHPKLFEASQYATLTTRKTYLTRGYGADLLLDLLGLIFGNDVDLLRSTPNAALIISTPQQREFLAALGELRDRHVLLKGQWTAVHDSITPGSARVQALVLRLTLPNGLTVSSINTRLTVTDQQGGTAEQSKSGQPALGLYSSDGSSSVIEFTEGYARAVQSDTKLEQGQTVTIRVSETVSCVDHDQLTAFLAEHKSSFTESEYQAIVGAEAFGDPTRTPDLLTGILGAKLASSFGYFVGATGLEIAAYNEDDRDFVMGLTSLQNRSHLLTGEHSAVGVGPFGAVPNVYVPRVRLTLPGGSQLSVIGMRAAVADADGRSSEVQSQKDAPPLQLTRL